MNIDRFSPLLKRTSLLLSLMAGSFLLAACGGGSDKKSSASSSSLSISSSLRSSFSAASVPPNGSGIWPSVKVEAQATKVLTFDWTPVEGATFYKLYKYDAVTGGVTQIGDDIIGTRATDAIGVHVHDWVNNYYYIEACNASACEKSDLTFTATEMIKSIGYFKASNADAFDWFGWSISLSADGLTMAVGAPAEDSKATGVNGDQANNDSINSGAVYLFVKEGDRWVQQAYLKASNTEQPNINSNRVLYNDRFGYRVALSDDGNTLAVSALLEDSPSFGINCNQDNYEATNTGASSDPSDDLTAAANFDVGAVYIFNRTDGAWSQNAFVKPIYSTVHAFNNPSTPLRFGDSLALSGDGKTLAVGTAQDFIGRSGVFTPSSAANSSAAQCLEYYPSSAASTSSVSSSSSSVSSSTSSATSSSSSFLGGTGSGAVYTFRLTETGWTEEAHIKASNAQTNDAFGTSVALSTDGNTLVVGAVGEDSQAQGVNGNQADNSCFYVNSQTSQYVLDLSCKTAVNYVSFGINNGAAYVFNRTDGVWVQTTYLKPPATFFTTLFGSSVDISGDGSTLVVGARGDTNDTVDISTPDNIDSNQVQRVAAQLGSGSAYVYRRTGESWAPEARIKPATTLLGAEFGGSVSLSHDGNILAVGAFRESSNAAGINGDAGDTSMTRAGAAFVYIRNNTVWTQKSYVKSPTPGAYNDFGLNVKLSGDGQTMAVGAHRESEGANTSASASSVANSNSSAASSENKLEASGVVYIY